MRREVESHPSIKKSRGHSGKLLRENSTTFLQMNNITPKQFRWDFMESATLAEFGELTRKTSRGLKASIGYARLQKAGLLEIREKTQEQIEKKLEDLRNKENIFCPLLSKRVLPKKK